MKNEISQADFVITAPRWIVICTYRFDIDLFFERMTYEEKIHTLNQPHHFHHWLIFEFISFRSEILLLLIAKLLFRAASKTNITLIHFPVCSLRSAVCSLQMSYTEFISRYYWRDLKSRYGNRQTANVRFKFKVFKIRPIRAGCFGSTLERARSAKRHCSAAQNKNTS